MKFIKEFFNRFQLKTPSFFQVFQKVGIIGGILSGIPLLLTSFQSELGIKLPEIVHVLSQKAAVGGAIIMWIMAKLPAQNAQTVVRTTNNLPYTDKKD